LNILITGSSSPLGTYFVRRITKIYSDCKIFVLGRTNYGPNNERVEYIIHDLKTDTFDCDETFDVVIHMASASVSTQNTDEFSIVNLEGSIRLFENLVLTENATILNISSISVYDEPFAEILTEGSNKTSSNFYGLSKLQFENAIDKMFKNSNICVLSCRLPVVLVEGARNNFMAKWLQQIQMGNPITIFNPNSLFNACISGEDIFDFFIQFREKHTNQNLVCNLSSSEPIRVIEAAKLMINSVGGPTRIIEKQAHKPPQLVTHKLAAENGFKPRSVKDCIRLFTSV
jgi:nucleoside-diphosphate-sugar epimerase